MLDWKGVAVNMDKGISKAVKKCEQIIQFLIQNGYTKHICEKELKKAIIRFAGLDPRTFKKYVEALILLDYIEKIGKGVYQIKNGVENNGS